MIYDNDRVVTMVMMMSYLLVEGVGQKWHLPQTATTKPDTLTTAKNRCILSCRAAQIQGIILGTT